MAVLGDLVGVLAAQHVDQVAGAEALARVLLEAVDAAQRLARGLGARPRSRAGVRQLSQLPQRPSSCLAEVAEQAHAAAVVRFGKRQQRVELAALARA